LGARPLNYPDEESFSVTSQHFPFHGITHASCSHGEC
jgi:hypothetical protein